MDLQREYPILEFDNETQAMIEPRKLIRTIDIPRCAVACFFQDVIATLVQEHKARVIRNLQSEIGVHPVYEIAFKGQRLAVFQPGVGAPLAAALMEEVIALGVDTIVACGGAGVLVSEIAVGHVVIPSAAVRDEGTSYHYLPPSREVTADPEAIAAIEQVLQAHHVPYITAKTWTTDAVYRETPAKVQLRKAEGCKVVEMETAAFLAVAQFRGVRFGQLLYGGDDLGSEEWDDRDWQSHSGRETLFWLAAEAALRMRG